MKPGIFEELPMPASAAQDEVTRVLVRAGSGEASAAEALLPLVYHELRLLAGRYMRREREDHTLDATALVHEAYLRLVDQTRVDWRDRTHFFAVAATAMRRILINHARDRQRLKRGGEARRLELTDLTGATPADDLQLLALDESLDRLGAIDARKARVVELRYFAGLEIEDVSGLLGVSPATVKRDWDFARAWLLRDMTEEPA
jgi:RNA polymerase sigma-70 factor, ECF subfamily